MCRMQIKLLASALLAFGFAPSAGAATMDKAAASPAAPEPCGTESDIAPQSAIRDHYQGSDAGAFLLGVGAIDEARPLPANPTVIVLSGSEVFGGNAAFIAAGSCVRGSPLFFDPVRYRLGRATVARRRAGLPIRLAALDALAAKGDAEAQLLAGSRHETMVPGSGRALIEAAARQGQALAMLELGYLVSGLDSVVLVDGQGPPQRGTGAAEPEDAAEMVPVGPDVPPVRFQRVVPGMNRVLANCWLKAAVASGDGEIAALGTSWLGGLAARMTTMERDSARTLWDRSAGATPAEMCR